jgi:hypothetical protein
MMCQYWVISIIVLEQGSTISHIECALLYDGVYALRISNGNKRFQQELLIKRK